MSVISSVIYFAMRTYTIQSMRLIHRLPCYSKLTELDDIEYNKNNNQLENKVDSSVNIRLDDVFYKQSDVAERSYQQTWKEYNHAPKPERIERRICRDDE